MAGPTLARVTRVDGNLALAVILHRMIGAAGGAFVALLVIWPRGWKEGVCRLVASIIIGTIFAPLVLDYAGWWDTADRNLAAGCAAGIIAWPAVGLVWRILQSDWLLSMLPGNGRAKG